MKLIDP